MARKTLKEFLISPDGPGTVLSEDRISYTIDPTLSGDVSRFDEGDDLGIDPVTGKNLVGTESMVNDFLVYLATLADVAYGPLPQPHGTAVSLNSRGGALGESGDRIGVPLESADLQGSEVFIPTSNTMDKPEMASLTEEMNSYSSGYFGATTMAELLSKDNVDPSLAGKHAHEMLAKVKGGDFGVEGFTYPAGSGTEPESAAVKAAGQVLTSRNRFSSAYDKREAFAPTGGALVGDPLTEDTFEGRDDMAGSVAYPNTFGKFDSSAVHVELTSKLEGVARSLMAKAAGWNEAGITPGTSADPDLIMYSSLMPAKPDISGDSKRDPATLRAKNAYDAPSDDDGASIRQNRGAFISEEVTEQSKSFGTTNVPNLPFEDGSAGFFAIAAALVSSLMTMVNNLANDIDVGVDATIHLDRGPYFPGQSTVIAKQAQYALLRNQVLVPTMNSYTSAVTRGMQIMFYDNGQGTAEAPGFWIAVAKKMFRSYFSISAAGKDAAETFASKKSSIAGIASVLAAAHTNDIISMMNVLATVGDVSLTANNPGSLYDRIDGTTVWDVDRMPDGPATRIAKSRSGNGLTANALAWRGNSLPSLYQIPRNVILASLDMGTLSYGANPLKGMMGTSLVKNTYVDVFAEGPNARIPNDIVERMENTLDAEYVPFYFHDLRTNEIVAFHAFLDGLSDSYQPNWTKQAGYGRMDNVLIHRNTTRSLRFSFYVAATSKEDFDEMWWKINKLTTLVYPQWTEGTKMATQRKNSSTNEVSTFVQPFSQVLGSSPIIRLRIGDVIKSNYSNFNLARIFGIGNTGITPKPPEEAGGGLFNMGALVSGLAGGGNPYAQFESVFNLLYGSPLTWANGLDTGDATGTRALRAGVSQILVNGFGNPLGTAVIMRELQDPDSKVNVGETNITAAGLIQRGASNLRASKAGMMGYTPLSFPLLRPTTRYLEATDGTKFRITRPYKCLIGFKRSSVDLINAKASSANQSATMKGPSRSGDPLQKTLYEATIFDFNAPASLFMKKFKVSHADLMPNPGAIFNTYVGPAISIATVLDSVLQGVANLAATAIGIPADTLDLGLSDSAGFMKAEHNPLVRSFQSTSGRGLAGGITSLTYEWLDGTNTWEIDWNSRAPKYAKVSMNFDVIHDIPPGLDYSGFNRAPIYNVGDVMRWVGGDVYADDGLASEDAFKAQGRHAVQKDRE